MTRNRRFVPPGPQDTVHGVQTDQSDMTQSTGQGIKGQEIVSVSGYTEHGIAIPHAEVTIKRVRVDVEEPAGPQAVEQGENALHADTTQS